MTSDALAGRRLIVLLFDVSSMQPEDVQRAVDSARKFVKEQMAAADLVAVATVGSTLDVLTDFTGERERVDAALGTLAYTDGIATEPPPRQHRWPQTRPPPRRKRPRPRRASSTCSTTTSGCARCGRSPRRCRPSSRRRRSSISAPACSAAGRTTSSSCARRSTPSVRAHVAIYPIDVRGLQAVVPGGDARQASGRGQGMFSGRGVRSSSRSSPRSQDTLVSLAGETGGRAFTDSNDFGEAFTRVQRDMSAYYLLGYSSTNPAKDGRFRRVQVRVKREGLRVEARAGYYAARDFAHTNRGDRETQLQEQLFSEVSATDVPVLVTGGFFRLAADRYYVPITVAIPGSAVTVPAGKDKATLDVLGHGPRRAGPAGRTHPPDDGRAGGRGRRRWRASRCCISRR